METTTAPKPFVFVLMPFAKEFDDVYKLGIKAAAEESGYYCERLDEQIFDETMLPRIYNQISKADIVVADMTGKNANVFYEVGYSHALNKRTVLLTKTANDIPSDLKHHIHIVYEGSITELKSKLCERLTYYRSNPEVSSIDPFSDVELSINGKKISTSISDIQEVDAKIVTQFESQNTRVQALKIEIASYLKIDSAHDHLSFEVLLITSPFYKKSLVIYDHGHSVEYDSINDCGERTVHKPNANLGGSRGSWDMIPFHLRSNSRTPQFSTSDMTLRLICQGLVRDISLRVNPI